MVLSFAAELPPSSVVHVVVSSCADSEDASTAEKIPASRVNPFSYTFNAPSGQSDSYMIQYG